MDYSVAFGVIFVAFFVLRIIAATIFFYVLLPQGDRCPCCDTPTIRVQSKGWNIFMPWFRTSWCYHCHWEGMLRHGAITPVQGGGASDKTISPPAAPTSRPGPSRTT